MGNSTDQIVSEQPQQSNTGSLSTAQNINHAQKSRIQAKYAKPQAFQMENREKNKEGKVHQAEQSSSEEDPDQKITGKNKRVLRIMKNIIGEDKLDPSREQILIDLIENKGNTTQKSKTQSKRIYEEYLQLQKERQEKSDDYFFKIAERNIYRKPVDAQPSSSHEK